MESGLVGVWRACGADRRLPAVSRRLVVGAAMNVWTWVLVGALWGLALYVAVRRVLAGGRPI